MDLDDPLQLEFFINLPALITLVVAIVLVAVNRHRHPPAARWALFAFTWLFITYILEIIWRNIGVAHLLRNRQAQISCLLGLSICEALSYVFFLVSFFAALTPYRQRHFYEDDLLDDFPRRPIEDDPNLHK